MIFVNVFYVAWITEQAFVIVDSQLVTVVGLGYRKRLKMQGPGNFLFMTIMTIDRINVRFGPTLRPPGSPESTEDLQPLIVKYTVQKTSLQR